jgi:hypothetical protein
MQTGIIDGDALVAFIDARIEARLVALGVAATNYSTGVRPAILPPRVTARTFDRWCRSARVEGAARDGAGWTCTAAAWRSARAQGPARKSGSGISAESLPKLDADALLRGAGLRGTR